MRRTLISLVIFVIAIFAMTTTVQASWLSVMFFGRHEEYNTPGVNIAVDRYVPKAWFGITTLKVKYYDEKEAIFQGEGLSGTVLLREANEKGRDFAICITDPSRAVSGDENFKFPKRESHKGDFDADGKKLGGLRVLGTFRGRAGFFELDTKDLDIGTHFIDVYVLNGGRREKFTEKPLVIRIAQPLPEFIEAMKNSSPETLKQHGLEVVEEQPYDSTQPSTTPKVQPSCPIQPKDNRTVIEQLGAEEIVETPMQPNFHDATFLLVTCKGGKVQQIINTRGFDKYVSVKDRLVFRQGRTKTRGKVVGISPKRGEITVLVDQGYCIYKGSLSAVLEEGEK